MEVRNRFKGLDLIDRVPDEPWMEVPDIVQETGSQGILRQPFCIFAFLLLRDGFDRCLLYNVMNLHP